MAYRVICQLHLDETGGLADTWQRVEQLCVKSNLPCLIIKICIHNVTCKLYLHKAGGIYFLMNCKNTYVSPPKKSVSMGHDPLNLWSHLASPLGQVSCTWLWGPSLFLCIAQVYESEKGGHPLLKIIKWKMCRCQMVLQNFSKVSAYL